MNTRRNFLKKSTTLTASSFLPTNIFSAILPTELPLPNFNGLLDACMMFYGNFQFVEFDSYTDIFENFRCIYKFTNLQKKCFVMNPSVYLTAQSDSKRFILNSKFKLKDDQLKTLGINLNDFHKIETSWYNYLEIVMNNCRSLPYEKWEELLNLPEYKNCCVEIPFEKMAKILGKDDSSSPLQFFAFNGTDEWHDYFDVFLESKGIQNFKNQTSKSLENIGFKIDFEEYNIKFLQKVKERLQLNKQVVTHCPEVIKQVNQLIKAIHVHVEDYKKISNSNLQEKHFNQDPDWYFDNTDIFANTKERFYE